VLHTGGGSGFLLSPNPEQPTLVIVGVRLGSAWLFGLQARLVFSLFLPFRQSRWEIHYEPKIVWDRCKFNGIFKGFKGKKMSKDDIRILDHYYI